MDIQIASVLHGGSHLQPEKYPSTEIQNTERVRERAYIERDEKDGEEKEFVTREALCM